MPTNLECSKENSLTAGASLEKVLADFILNPTDRKNLPKIEDPKCKVEPTSISA
jgi:hypothetical protein